jgi:hypothetical protein
MCDSQIEFSHERLEQSMVSSAGVVGDDGHYLVRRDAPESLAELFNRSLVFHYIDLNSSCSQRGRNFGVKDTPKG